MEIKYQISNLLSKDKFPKASFNNLSKQKDINTYQLFVGEFIKSIHFLHIHYMQLSQT